MGTGARVRGGEVGVALAALVVLSLGGRAWGDGEAAAQALADPLAEARVACTAGRPCPHVPLLLRLTTDPASGPEALAILGDAGDPSAVGIVAQVAAHGESPALAGAARRALNTMALKPACRAELERLAGSAPDPAIVGVATQALATAPSAPARGPEAALNDSGTRGWGDPTRIVYGPTAFGRPAGQIRWQALDLGYHTVDYGLSDHLEIGIGVALPVAVYAFIPHAKLTFSPSEKVHLGLLVQGGVLGTYVESGGAVGVLFGGPIVTLGDESLMLNAYCLGAVAKAWVFGETDSVEWAVFPGIGGSARLSRLIRANLEVVMPLAQDLSDKGRVWAILYGIRLANGKMYGDVGFLLPIFDGVGEVLKFIPMGIPLLSFGVLWD